MQSSPAHYDASQCHERLVNRVVAVVTNAQALELVHECQRLLDKPAVHAKAAAVRGVPPGDLGGDCTARELHAVTIAVVPAVADQSLREVREEAPLEGGGDEVWLIR